MKKQVFVLLTAAVLLCACGKEEEPVVTVQPAFGEDVAGYAGFANLKDYTLTSGGEETVLYLPSDEKAYVGNTTAIVNKDGVECEANLNPLYAEDVKNKSVDQRLVYTLERDYRDKASEFSGLDIAKIAELNENGYGAYVSYLVFDDASKSYHGEWIDYMMFDLPDGRIINIKLKVDSTNETDATAEVISDMENYLGVDIPYEPGMLQAKIDSYEPDEDEAKKNDSTPVEMGDLVMYVPRGFESDSTYASMASKFATSMAGVEEDKVKIFIPENMFETKPDPKDLDMLMIFTVDDAGISGGEMGKYNDGELSTLAQYLTRALEQAMPGARLSGRAERMEVGYGIKIFGTGINNGNSDSYDGGIYYIIRGNTAYMIVGFTPSGSGRVDEILESIDYVYDSAEVK